MEPSLIFPADWTRVPGDHAFRLTRALSWGTRSSKATRLSPTHCSQKVVWTNVIVHARKLLSSPALGRPSLRSETGFHFDGFLSLVCWCLWVICWLLVGTVPQVWLSDPSPVFIRKPFCAVFWNLHPIFSSRAQVFGLSRTEVLLSNQFSPRRGLGKSLILAFMSL